MIATPRTISDECSAVAFYGIKPSEKTAESFYQTMVRWFNDLGCPPDRLGVTGPGHSRKVISFTRGSARLLKRGFTDVSDIELISNTPGAQLPRHDYYATATYNGRAGDWYAFVVARSSLATLSSSSMLPLAQTLAGGLNPDYGIGYRMEHQRGPEWDVVGIGYGEGILIGEAYEEARNRSRWGDMAMPKQLWRQGILRDVYPWNFLTRPHLTRQIDGLPLEQWVRQDASRGTLSRLCAGISLWEVPDPSIPEIRRTLRQESIIFDWRNYADQGHGEDRRENRRKTGDALL